MKTFTQIREWADAITNPAAFGRSLVWRLRREPKPKAETV